MNQVISQDGTRIAFDRKGEGPAVILVGAVLSQRAFDPLMAPLLDLLSDRFTVYFYDRRGRGDSGNTPPYAVEREIEDIDALVAEAGGSAFIYGMSSGAVLALEAARRLDGIRRLAMFEPPVIVDDSRPPLPADYVERLEEHVAAGRRGDAVELLMTKAIGIPDEFVAGMRQDPSWEAMEAVAHTIAHDGRIMGETMSGKPLPAEWASVGVPTLVIAGELSEPFMHTGARAVADAVGGATVVTLPGQDHAVSPEAQAPVLAEFFGKE
jgi:pimeloyl-ACP methyl ester carboxylesterase